MHRAVTTAAALALSCTGKNGGEGSDCAHPTTVFADEDRDGHGNADDASEGCDPPAAFVSSDDDCDDANPGRSPAATEGCNGIDDDCDGLVDDDDPSVVGTSLAYADRDDDGFGAGPGVLFCQAPDGFVAASDDCDDETADAHPGAREVCGNDADEDCDEDAPGCRLDGDVGLDASDIAILADPLSAYEQLGATMTMLGASLVVAAPGDPWSDAVLIFEGLGPGTYDEHDASATLTRDDPYRALGTSLAAGDVDGDGTDDLLIAAPFAGISIAATMDEIYVELGPVSTHVIGGTVVRGDAGFAHVVRSIGDFDGDGLDDAAVGSPGLGAYGSASVWLGATLSGSVDSGADVSMTAISDSARELGTSVGSADVDGDGRTDLVVGAPTGTGSVPGSGCAFAILGTVAPDAALTLPTDADVAFLGAAVYDTFGAALGGGDLDADGAGQDVWVGAPGKRKAYGFLEPSGSVKASQADTTLGEGKTSFGSNGELAGDLDGDGHADLVVADSAYGSYAGAAYVYPTPLASLPAASLLGPAAYTWATSALATGDLGGDGYGDVFVGAPYCIVDGAHGCVSGFVGGP